jgi:anaerobic selenocysteine-containing dehydrogenase
MAVRTDFAGCMLCEPLCGLEVEHDGTTVSKVRGDAQHAFSRGHICPKGVALQRVVRADWSPRIRTRSRHALGRPLRRRSSCRAGAAASSNHDRLYL